MEYLPCSVKLDTLEWSGGGDGGGSGPVQHQGDLPEVVRRAQDTNLPTGIRVYRIRRMERERERERERGERDKGR